MVCPGSIPGAQQEKLNMRKLTLVKVTFEALGKEHVRYTETLDFEGIISEVSKLAPTAVVTNICTDICEASILKTQGMNQVIDWNKALEKRFIDSEAIK